MALLVGQLSTLVIMFLLALSILAVPVPSFIELQKRITHQGRGTWFYPGLGNCGDWDTNEDPIIALSEPRYGTGGNCNQWVQVTNKATGKSAYGKVRDSCEACGEYDLDMSPSLFQDMAPLSQGVMQISWHFMAKDWSP